MIECKIITPKGLKFNGKVDLIEIKTSEGSIVIQNEHIPIVASVPISTMYLKLENGVKRAAAIGGGILTTTKTTIDIISSSFDFFEDINPVDTQKQIEKLEKIKQSDPKNIKNNVMLEIEINRMKARK